jgi:capsid portal protein
MSNLNETAQLLNVAAVAGSVRRTRLIKAATLGEDGALDETVSRAVQNSQDARTMFNQAGALEPPYEPDSLCMIIEHSSNLRQNIDGYVTNIDGFGHHYEPQYSLDNPEIAKEIRAMVEDERAASNDSSEVTDQAIQERLEALRKQARREYLALRAFFDNCTAGSGYSFIKLRRLMRQDLEVGGNAFWEATRDRAGRLKRLVYVPAHTMRLMPLDKDYTLYTRRERKSPTAFETVTALKRFRRYVQVINGISTYFKEFGDPRYLSKTNGMYAKPDADAAKAAEDHATEIIHFAIHSPRTP